MRKRTGLWSWLAISAVACATSGGGAVGTVELAPPQPAHGDDQSMAWPFTVVHGGESETLADFHLRIESGGELVGVRPDGENPDQDARFQWRGELRGGEGYWIGDALTPGNGVTLTLLVRPAAGQEPRLRVVHWPTNGRNEPVGPETCQIWTYDTDSREAAAEPC